LQEEMIKIV